MRRMLSVIALICAFLLPSVPVFADPAKGTLTINTESTDVWFNVAVTGASAPADTKLADAAGEHAADVVATVGACPSKEDAEQLEIGLSGATWCVHVSGLQAGYSVSGTVASPETSLSLTVNRKVKPCIPLLWSVGALALAAIISWLSSTYVPGLTSRLRRKLYERDHGIAGLGNWVKTAAANGIMADDDIVARAIWARKYGIEQVMTVRGKLRATLADTSLAVPDGSPLRQACQVESNRPKTDIKREDVLTDEGEPSDTAAKLLTALTDADSAIRNFTSAADALIARMADSARKQQATASRDGMLASARQLTEEGVPQFINTLDNVIQSGTFQDQPVEQHNLLSAAALSGIAPRDAVAQLATSIKAAFAPAATYLPAVLLAFVIMAGAVATVFSAQYLANPHFGTAADFLTLIVTAYGSAQATAIAAALLLMHSPKPWYGSSQLR